MNRWRTLISNRLRALAIVCTLASMLAACGDSSTEIDSGANGPVPPLSAEGRWLTDATGRVVMLHGFNEVAKSPPFYPAAFDFGEDDAAFLAAEGFNGIRLGIDFRGLMPEPGVVDDGYVENLASTVDVLARHAIFVLLDFHQDGFAPMYNGNGLPDWMAIDDGLPNPPDAVFPLYYIQNPAMQRAFENFWANRQGPGGIGLQDYFVQGIEKVVARFAGNPWVLGYEPINEPWSGAEWRPCTEGPVGCPDLEQSTLAPFYRRVGDAIREITSEQLIFVEPFVLFNFGQAPTTMPGTDPRVALSFHSYAIDSAGEESVLELGIAAAERDGAPVLVTEFGATLDSGTLDRIAGQMESQLLPWLEWAYNESVIADTNEPAGPDNLRSREAFDALVRPYPTAIAGTPTRIAFDLATKAFDLTYDAVTPSGAALAGDRVTVVSVPRRHYPQGYEITTEGARVTSPPCAEVLTLANEPSAASISLHIAPAAAGCG